MFILGSVFLEVQGQIKNINEVSMSYQVVFLGHFAAQILKTCQILSTSKNVDQLPFKQEL